MLLRVQSAVLQALQVHRRRNSCGFIVRSPCWTLTWFWEYHAEVQFHSSRIAQARLSWEPGPSAVSYDVYLSESFDHVNERAPEAFRANQVGTFLVVGFRGFPYPDGLVPGTTYYWRVDEIDDSNQESPKKGSIRSFSIAPRTAYDPDPPNGAKSVEPEVRLSWQEGFGAKLHTVYFSDDVDTVTNASGRRP